MRNRTYSADIFPDHSPRVPGKPIAYRSKKGAISQWLKDQSHRLIQGAMLKIRSHKRP